MLNCLQIVSPGEDVTVLNDFISKIPGMNLLRSFDNLMDAYSFSLKHKPQLLFLDLDLLEDHAGFAFIRNLPFHPAVVFISSHPADAVEAFEVGALDFLPKPFIAPRLFKTVNRIIAHFEIKSESPVFTEESSPITDFLFLKVDNRFIRVNTRDILYITAQSDYVRIHIRDQRPLLLLESLKNIQERLPLNHFIRVHRSYIVSIDKINCIQRKQIQIGEERIPISDSYYPAFLQQIGRFQFPL